MIDKSDYGVNFSFDNFPFRIGFKSDLIFIVIPGQKVKKVLNYLNLTFLVTKGIEIQRRKIEVKILLLTLTGIILLLIPNL